MMLMSASPGRRRAIGADAADGVGGAGASYGVIEQRGPNPQH